MRTTALSRACVAALLALSAQWAVEAQWTNRYPKVAGFSHHVYLEGYELPTLGSGPTDPSASPDGASLAFAARGWLWLLDLQTGEARRLTRGGGKDSRPAWSPDGRRIAFVRDDGRDTRLVQIEVATGAETVIVDTPAIDLDPAYSHDGGTVFYTSAEVGDFDLWQVELATGAKRRLTTDEGLELRPLPLPGGRAVVFVAKGQGLDRLTVLDLATGERRVLAEHPIASQMRPALHSDGRSIAVGMPSPDAWDLWLVNVDGGPPIRIVSGGMPLMPAWSADGTTVYFVEADADRQFRLHTVSRRGGDVSLVSVLSWTWGEPTARIRIRTRNAGERTPRPARLHVVDRDGHPAIPDSGQVWFDGQNGLPFFYSPGTLTVELPAGEVRIMAAAGFGSAAVSAVGRAVPGETASLDLEFAPLWNSQAEGWYSGDHHFHLNYGGPYTLRPEDLILMMRGEDLDVGTPLMANLQTRVNDLDWFNWAQLDASGPLIAFGQEIRPPFGHLGLIGISTPYWPWFWGPDYAVFGNDEWLNGEALAHARRQRGVNAYVHPVMRPGPFPGGGQAPTGLPLGLVPDAILGDVDTLEVACLWSDELGTTDAWYRLLNVGVPIAPSAGTDVMTDFYRTMAVGTTRVYVKPDGPLTLESYLDALRAGRSFVSTGPQLLLTAAGIEPGGVIQATAGGPVAWELTAISPLAFETVEVIVNGVGVWKAAGLRGPGRQTWKGTVTVPPGGWMAARVAGGPVQWPAMDSYPFAHTAPIWFGRIGSVDRVASGAAARELLQWMDVAQAQLRDRYDGTNIPALLARFEQARRRLEVVASGGSTP